MRRDRIDGMALFAVLFLCYAYTFPRWADWNQNSRFDLVVAIVDHGTLSIDCCVANTGDYAVVDGHAYTDKAPGLSLLAVPVYAAFRTVASLPAVEARLVRLSRGAAFRDTLREGGTGLLLEKIQFALGLTAATVMAVALPASLAGVVFYFFLARFTPRRGVRLAVTLAYALATPAFTYGGSFYAHQLAAAALFTAFVVATRPAPRRSKAELAAIGFLLAFAVITEYPAVLIAAPIALVGAGGWAPPSPSQSVPPTTGPSSARRCRWDIAIRRSGRSATRPASSASRIRTSRRCGESPSAPFAASFSCRPSCSCRCPDSFASGGPIPSRRR